MKQHTSMAGQRQLRVGEQLRHALAWALERGDLRDPDLAAGSLTVTEVRMSPDLRVATVFVVPLGGGRDAPLRALVRAKGFLRRRVAESVQLKFVPELVFRVDPSFDEADRIQRILRRPDVARDLAARSETDGGDGGEGE